MLAGHLFLFWADNIPQWGGLPRTVPTGECVLGNMEGFKEHLEKWHLKVLTAVGHLLCFSAFAFLPTEDEVGTCKS